MGFISSYFKKINYKLKPKKNLDNIIIANKNLDYLFNAFGSDKGSLVLNKYPGHSYGKFYEKHLNKFKDENFNMLEIGAYYGASVAAFYFFFKKANIFCLDKNFKFKFASSRINFFNCDTSKQLDLKNLEEFLLKKNCQSFDLIIDDASHLLSDIKKNFLFFFQYLKSGGYYVIEDYNHPRYYEESNDIKNNEQLIDDFLNSVKQKKFFNSQISNFNSNNKLFKMISDINQYKGNMKLSREMMIAQDGLVSEKKLKKLENINVSDIVFIKKK